MSLADVQRWKQIARARRATAAMALADEAGHEIFIIVPDWRQWPVAPWYTAKLQRWVLMDRRQRKRLLRRVARYMTPGERKALLRRGLRR